MTAEARLVCFRCAQIKQACDGKLPCSRCARLGLPCRPREPGRNSVHDDNFGELPKAQIRRVQTGCLLCKRRKKKCDEAKPKCGDCKRLCLECVWPEERKKPRSSKTRTPESPEQVIKKESVSGSDSSSRSASLTSLPIRSSVSPKTIPARPWNGFWPTDSPPETRPVSSHKPSWDSTAWKDPLSPYSSHGSLAWWEDPSTNSLSVYLPQLLPQLGAMEDRALLNHYSTIVSSVLSRKASVNNPFNHYLLPMAGGNEMVLHCMLALSANHWRKVHPALAERGLYHQGKATSALAALLPEVDGERNGDVALLASLLLCMTDLFDGESQGWKLHLEGARKLLLNLRSQRIEKMNSHSRFLVRLARFIDSAATTSTCRAPLMGDDEDAIATADRLTAAADEEDAALYGVPKQLYHLVDLVNNVSSKRKTRVDAASEAAFRSFAAGVEDRINIWAAHHRCQTQQNRSLSPLQTDVLHASTAFEYAIRLRLHQIVEGYKQLPPVPGYVSNIVDAVQRIRYGSPLEGSLVYPLVMAGGACSEYEHRFIIRDRLTVMEKTCGFGYVYNALDLMERVWKQRDETAGSGKIVNWAEIRFFQMNGLVIF